MKKIRLNVANLDATEILSRDQLKSIFGGSGGSGSSAYCPPGENLYNCTYTIFGYSSSGGAACGSNSSVAWDAVATTLRQQLGEDYYTSNPVIECN